MHCSGALLLKAVAMSDPTSGQGISEQRRQSAGDDNQELPSATAQKECELKDCMVGHNPALQKGCGRMHALVDFVQPKERSCTEKFSSHLTAIHDNLFYSSSQLITNSTAAYSSVSSVQLVEQSPLPKQDRTESHHERNRTPHHQR